MAERRLKNIKTGGILAWTAMLARRNDMVEVDEYGIPLTKEDENKGAAYWKDQFDQLKAEYDELLAKVNAEPEPEVAKPEEPPVEQLLAEAGATPVLSLEDRLAAFVDSSAEGKEAFRAWSKEHYGIMPEMKYSLDRMKDIVRERDAKQAA